MLPAGIRAGSGVATSAGESFLWISPPQKKSPSLKLAHRMNSGVPVRASAAAD